MLNKLYIPKTSIYRKLANSLTIFRLCVALPILLLLSNGYNELAWFLFISGGISDLLDGWMARKAQDGANIYGAQLDPFADKIILLSPFLWLVHQNVLQPWAIWIIISRELFISGWRSSQKGGGPASNVGKIKTFTQFTSISLLIFPKNWGSNYFISLANQIGIVFFWISFVFALISAFKYLFPQSDYHQN